jgi:RNA polymerase sigma factor (sigma-70 family)
VQTPPTIWPRRTFVEAFRGRDRFDRSRANARPWLFGIAVNLLRHHYRDEERMLAALARTAVDPVAPEGEAHTNSLSRHVAAALEALPAGDRDVLLLFAWEDLGYREIAEALDIPVGTVQSRLSRARAHVRERLESSARGRQIQGGMLNG